MRQGRETEPPGQTGQAPARNFAPGGVRAHSPGRPSAPRRAAAGTAGPRPATAGAARRRPRRSGCRASWAPAPGLQGQGQRVTKHTQALGSRVLALIPHSLARRTEKAQVPLTLPITPGCREHFSQTVPGAGKMEGHAVLGTGLPVWPGLCSCRGALPLCSEDRPQPRAALTSFLAGDPVV